MSESEGARAQRRCGPGHLRCGLFMVASVGIVFGLLLSASAGLSMLLLALSLAGFVVAQRRGIVTGASRAWDEHPLAMTVGSLLAVLCVAGLHRSQPFALLTLATLLIYAVACLGLTIQFGYAGVVNFAGAAFFGIGAYATAALAEVGHVPSLLLPVLSGVASALLGCLLIVPILRTRGHYVAIITIAFSVLFKSFIQSSGWIGGSEGSSVPGLSFLGWNFNSNFHVGQQTISSYMSYVLLSLLALTLVLFLVRRLNSSWLGLMLDAVRLDPVAATSFGVSVPRVKILAFFSGNFLLGLAGSIYAMMTGYVSPGNFTLGDSLLLVSILILGGMGNPWGVLPGVLIIVMLPEKLQAMQEYRLFIFSVLVVGMILIRPSGILPRRRRNYAGAGLIDNPGEPGADVGSGVHSASPSQVKR